MKTAKVLMKGNEAMAEAAIRAGCRYYFGYPITPQNEVPAYMSQRLPEVNGVFVQAESELAAINMVYGAGACGFAAMTTSSSPGISLMQEGISYMAGAEVPAVIANMMRGGPGLGNISPSQADYLQATKGGGHGDYNIIVYAPSSVQNLIDLTYKSFDIAFKYRVIVMILGDGILGQMSESVTLPEFKEPIKRNDGFMGHGGKQVIIRSLYLDPENQLEIHNHKLQMRYSDIKKNEVIFDTYKTDDCEYMIVAYGTVARVARASVDLLRERGVKAGLFQPVTLWPFPSEDLFRSVKNVKKVFVAEMAVNQLEQDVRLSVGKATDISGINKLGGAIFSEEEIADSIIADIKNNN